jgi:hypothetical protein
MPSNTEEQRDEAVDELARRQRSIGPRLIVSDGNACWLFPDGSHRGVTQGDADTINWLLNYARQMQMEVRINGQ